MIDPVIIIDLLVSAIMVTAAIGAMFSKNLVSSVILAGAVSIVASFIFLRLGAPDVAMTEASIGAALSMLIFLAAIHRTGEVEQ